MASSMSGGFVKHDIPTPPASSVASSAVGHPLPHPRNHPLRPGGPKESQLVQYLDQGILKAKRRWAKRHFEDKDAGDVKGYHSFKEAAKDIDGFVDLVWVSGTPNLQIHYLLSLALLVVDFLPSFPPAPKATFRLIEKLDIAFSSLLQGHDLDTGERLPGFDRGKTVSTTEKVRMKSVAERTRVTVAGVMSQDVPRDEGDDNVMDTDEEDFNMDEDDEDDDAEDHQWDMDIARVFDRTISELGEVLKGPPIGIITDD